MTVIQVANIPVDLDLKVLDVVLGALEAALQQVGAERVWATGGPALVVMAELPDKSCSTLILGQQRENRECAWC